MDGIHVCVCVRQFSDRIIVIMSEPERERTTLSFLSHTAAAAHFRFHLASKRTLTRTTVSNSYMSDRLYIGVQPVCCPAYLTRLFRYDDMKSATVKARAKLVNRWNAYFGCMFFFFSLRALMYIDLTFRRRERASGISILFDFKFSAMNEMICYWNFRAKMKVKVYHGIYAFENFTK